MITCKKCGIVDDYRIEQKANNKVAFCNNCSAYIQNIPYDKPRFYIGKYKGKAIEELDDLPYLQWAYNNMYGITSTMKNAIRSRISDLELLMK